MSNQDIRVRQEKSKALLNVMLSVFQDVLHQQGVQPDDDFFDLGGDSLAATAMVMALEALGIDLPISALFETPTPAGLAAAIDSGGLLREQALVTLKPGTGQQAVFIAPGASGSALELVAFARKVETTLPIYGLQPRDEAGHKHRHTSIEQAARFYLPLIRAAQPQGPYILAGYSLGGATALELAQMLLAAGDRVERLIVLDTLTPIEHFPFSGKLRFWRRRLLHHTSKLRRMSHSDMVPYILKRAQALTRDFRPRVPAAQAITLPDSISTNKSTPRSSMTEAAIVFLKYKPKFFAGDVMYLQSNAGVEGKTHYPDILWRHLAQRVTIHQVSGDHETILSRHSAAASAAFTTSLSTCRIEPIPNL